MLLVAQFGQGHIYLGPLISAYVGFKFTFLLKLLLNLNVIKQKKLSIFIFSPEMRAPIAVAVAVAVVGLMGWAYQAVKPAPPEIHEINNSTMGWVFI